MESAIIVSVVSLLFIAIFTALEGSFETFSKFRYEVDKKQEKRYAKVLEYLLDREGEVILSLKLASDIFLVLFGMAIASVFANIFLGIAVALASVLVISKLMPMAVAAASPDFITEYLIYVAKGVYIVLSPFAGKEPERHIPEKEESHEMVFLQNALNFSDVIVRECMIPRTEICAIPDTASIDELLSLFAESKYSRILVYHQNIDKIIGYIHSKDLFTGGKPIKELIRSINYVPEEMGARALLTTMIKNKRSIAVVNDEYGGTAGIVTLEDIIEEIFGEISDELDREELTEKVISENEYLLSGRHEIKYLNKSYDLDLPESDDYETLGGFITWFHENIPNEGDVLNYQDFEFTILKTSSNRLDSVVLRKITIFAPYKKINKLK